MRRPATDAPVQKPRYQHGVISAVIAEGLYQVNTGKESRLATYDKGVLAVDTEVDIRMHGERNHWRIEYAEAAEPPTPAIFVPSPIWHEFSGNPNGPVPNEYGLFIGRVGLGVIHSGAASGGLGLRNIQTNRTVWFSDDELCFYRVDAESANDGNWLYRSFDAGETWEAVPPVIRWGFATGNLMSALIYERWFDKTAPNWVHMFKKQDFGSGATGRGVWYNRYDKDTGTLLYPSPGFKANDASGGGPWASGGAARALSGRLYCWASFFLRWSAGYSDDGGVTWTPQGSPAFQTPPVSGSNDFPAYGFPDHASSNRNDILIIVPESFSGDTSGQFSICRYNSTTNTWTEIVFIASTAWTSPPFYTATYNRENGHIYFAFSADTNGPIRTFDIYGSTVTEMTPVEAEGAGWVRHPALTILESGRIICFYSKDITGSSATSTQVVGRYSDDFMLTWQDMDPYIWSSREYDNSGVFVDPAPIRTPLGGQEYFDRLTSMGTLGTRYQIPFGDSNASTGTLGSADMVIGSPCSIYGLRLDVDTAPGVGNSWTFTYLLNGAATGLSAVIADNMTSSVMSSGAIPAAPGQVVTMRITSSGSPANPGVVHRTVRIRNLPGVLQTFHAVPPGNAFGNGERIAAIVGEGASAQDNTVLGHGIGYAPHDGIITAIYGKNRTADGGGHTYSLQKNGSNLAGAALELENTAFVAITGLSHAFVRNDRLGWLVSATGALIDVSACITMVYTTEDTYYPIGGSAENITGTLVKYTEFGHVENAQVSNTESAVWVVVNWPFTVAGLTVHVASAPGAGQSVTFEVYDNGVGTGVSVTISGTDLVGTTEDIYEADFGSRLSLKKTSSSTSYNPSRVWWYSKGLINVNPFA